LRNACSGLVIAYIISQPIRNQLKVRNKAQ
jgi:hypothetical protein